MLSGLGFGVGKSGLAENVANDFAVHVGQSKVASLITVSQLLMVDPEQMKNGGLQIVYVYGVFDHVHAIVVGLSVTEPGLYPSTGQPVGETVRVMILP